MPDKVHFSAEKGPLKVISLIPQKREGQSYQHHQKRKRVRKRKRKGRGVVRVCGERGSGDNGERPEKEKGIGLLEQQEKLITIGRKGEGEKRVK